MANSKLTNMIQNELELAIKNSVENLNTIKTKNGRNFDLKAFLNQLINISQDKAFFITDEVTIQKMAQYLFKEESMTRYIIRKNKRKSKTWLREATGEAFEKISYRYENFNEIKPVNFSVHRNDISQNIEDERKNHFGLLEELGAHIFLVRHLDPYKTTKKHLQEGTPFIIIYISIILKYANLRFNEEVTKNGLTIKD